MAGDGGSGKDDQAETTQTEEENMEGGGGDESFETIASHLESCLGVPPPKPKDCDSISAVGSSAAEDVVSAVSRPPAQEVSTEPAVSAESASLGASEPKDCPEETQYPDSTTSEATKDEDSTSPAQFAHSTARVDEPTSSLPDETATANGGEDHVDGETRESIPEPMEVDRGEEVPKVSSSEEEPEKTEEEIPSQEMMEVDPQSQPFIEVDRPNEGEVEETTKETLVQEDVVDEDKVSSNDHNSLAEEQETAVSKERVCCDIPEVSKANLVQDNDNVSVVEEMEVCEIAVPEDKVSSEDSGVKEITSDLVLEEKTSLCEVSSGSEVVKAVCDIPVEGKVVSGDAAIVAEDEASDCDIPKEEEVVPSELEKESPCDIPEEVPTDEVVEEKTCDMEVEEGESVSSTEEKPSPCDIQEKVTIGGEMEVSEERVSCDAQEEPSDESEIGFSIDKVVDGKASPCDTQEKVPVSEETGFSTGQTTENKASSEIEDTTTVGSEIVAQTTLCDIQERDSADIEMDVSSPNMFEEKAACDVEENATLGSELAIPSEIHTPCGDQETSTVYSETALSSANMSEDTSSSDVEEKSTDCGEAIVSSAKMSEEISSCSVEEKSTVCSEIQDSSTKTSEDMSSSDVQEKSTDCSEAVVSSAKMSEEISSFGVQEKSTVTNEIPDLSIKMSEDDTSSSDVQEKFTDCTEAVVSSAKMSEEMSFCGVEEKSTVCSEIQVSATKTSEDIASSEVQEKSNVCSETLVSSAKMSEEISSCGVEEKSTVCSEIQGSSTKMSEDMSSPEVHEKSNVCSETVVSTAMMSEEMSSCGVEEKSTVCNEIQSSSTKMSEDMSSPEVQEKSNVCSETVVSSAMMSEEMSSCCVQEKSTVCSEIQGLSTNMSDDMSSSDVQEKSTVCIESVVSTAKVSEENICDVEENATLSNEIVVSSVDKAVEKSCCDIQGNVPLGTELVISTAKVSEEKAIVVSADKPPPSDIEIKASVPNNTPVEKADKATEVIVMEVDPPWSQATVETRKTDPAPEAMEVDGRKPQSTPKKPEKRFISVDAIASCLAARKEAATAESPLVKLLNGPVQNGEKAEQDDDVILVETSPQSLIKSLPSSVSVLPPKPLNRKLVETLPDVDLVPIPYTEEPSFGKKREAAPPVVDLVSENGDGDAQIKALLEGLPDIRIVPKAVAGVRENLERLGTECRMVERRFHPPAPAPVSEIKKILLQSMAADKRKGRTVAKPVDPEPQNYLQPLPYRLEERCRPTALVNPFPEGRIAKSTQVDPDIITSSFDPTAIVLNASSGAWKVKSTFDSADKALLDKKRICALRKTGKGQCDRPSQTVARRTGVKQHRIKMPTEEEIALIRSSVTGTLMGPDSPKESQASTPTATSSRGASPAHAPASPSFSLSNRLSTSGGEVSVLGETSVIDRLKRLGTIVEIEEHKGKAGVGPPLVSFKQAVLLPEHQSRELEVGTTGGSRRTGCEDVSSKALKMLERMSDYCVDSTKKPISPIVEALGSQQQQQQQQEQGGAGAGPPLTLFCLPPNVSCTARIPSGQLQIHHLMLQAQAQMIHQQQSSQQHSGGMTPEPCMLEPLIDIVEEAPAPPMPQPHVLDVSKLPALRQEGGLLNPLLAPDGTFMFKMEAFSKVDLLQQKCYSCDICSAVYQHSHMLRKHYLRLHVARSYISERDMEYYNIDHEPPAESAMESRLIFRCHTCKECFSSKNELKSHLTDHPPVTTKLASKPNKQYQCPNCDAVFRWRKLYGKHKKACKAANPPTAPAITPQPPAPAPPPAAPAAPPVVVVEEKEKPPCWYHCLYCNETFRNANKKKNHVMSLHPYCRKRHPCVFCKDETAFVTHVNLFFHLTEEHSDVYFACRACKERFARPDELNRHNSEKHDIHLEMNGETPDETKTTAAVPLKPFTCETCQRMFLLEGGLAGHNCGTPGKPASAEPKRTKMKKTPKGLKSGKGGQDGKHHEDCVDPETLFYSRVAGNIRENLLHHLDGKLDSQEVTEYDLNDNKSRSKLLNFSAGFSSVGSLSSDRDSLEKGGLNGGADLGLGPSAAAAALRAKTPWEKYNFPKNYDGRCGLTSYIKDTSYLDISTQLIMRRNLQRLNMLSNKETSSEDDVPSVLALERLAAECAESFGNNHQPAEEECLGELSGEWVRSRTYICSVCAWETPCLWTMEDHKYEVHPNISCPQHELVGEDQHLSKIIYRRLVDVSPPFQSRRSSLPHLPPAKDAVCTKCHADGFRDSSELHKHIMECAGEDLSALAIGLSPRGSALPSRSRRYRPKKKRSLRRRGLKRNIPQTPQKPPQKLRTKPGDMDTIQKMIANLPAKRATRRVIGFDEIDIKTRSQATIQNAGGCSVGVQQKPGKNGPKSGKKSSGASEVHHHHTHQSQMVTSIHRQVPKKEDDMSPPRQRVTDYIDTSAENGNVLSSLRMMPVKVAPSTTASKGTGTPTSEAAAAPPPAVPVLSEDSEVSDGGSKKNFLCTGCGLTFDNCNTFRKHRKSCIYYRESKVNLTCKTCGVKFPFLMALIEHSCAQPAQMPKLEIEKDLVPETNSPEVAPVLSPVADPKDSFICGISFVDGVIKYETISSVSKETQNLSPKQRKQRGKKKAVTFPLPHKKRGRPVGSVNSGRNLRQEPKRRRFVAPALPPPKAQPSSPPRLEPQDVEAPQKLPPREETVVAEEGLVKEEEQGVEKKTNLEEIEVPSREDKTESTAVTQVTQGKKEEVEKTEPVGEDELPSPKGRKGKGKQAGTQSSKQEDAPKDEPSPPRAPSTTAGMRGGGRRRRRGGGAKRGTGTPSTAKRRQTERATASGAVQKEALAPTPQQQRRPRRSRGGKQQVSPPPQSIKEEVPEQVDSDGEQIVLVVTPRRGRSKASSSEPSPSEPKKSRGRTPREPPAAAVAVEAKVEEVRPPAERVDEDEEEEVPPSQAEEQKETSPVKEEVLSENETKEEKKGEELPKAEAAITEPEKKGPTTEEDAPRQTTPRPKRSRASREISPIPWELLPDRPRRSRGAKGGSPREDAVSSPRTRRRKLEEPPTQEKEKIVDKVEPKAQEEETSTAPPPETQPLVEETRKKKTGVKRKSAAPPPSPPPAEAPTEEQPPPPDKPPVKRLKETAPETEEVKVEKEEEEEDEEEAEAPVVKPPQPTAAPASAIPAKEKRKAAKEKVSEKVKTKRMKLLKRESLDLSSSETQSEPGVESLRRRRRLRALKKTKILAKKKLKKMQMLGKTAVPGETKEVIKVGAFKWEVSKIDSPAPRQQVEEEQPPPKPVEAPKVEPVAAPVVSSSSSSGTPSVSSSVQQSSSSSSSSSAQQPSSTVHQSSPSVQQNAEESFLLSASATCSEDVTLVPPERSLSPAWSQQLWDHNQSHADPSLGTILDSVNKLLSEPESQYQPLLPQYSLEDLQKAMGASDAEMAVLQQLGEASLHDGIESNCKEEEDWNETCIMDLDNQTPSNHSSHQPAQHHTPHEPQVYQPPHQAQQGVSTGGRSLLGAFSLGGGTHNHHHHLHNNNNNNNNSNNNNQHGCQPPHQMAASASSSSSSFGQVVSSTSSSQLQHRDDNMTIRGKGNSSSLLAAHSGKQVVCPTCSCQFMGFPALQLHVHKVHNSNNSASSSSGSNSQHSGIKLKGRRPSTMSVHKPDLTSLNRRVVLESSKESRLICFMCQQILPSNLMCSHLVVEHSLKSADITKCTTLSGEPAGDGCVGGERLKNKMSSALGDLLDRAVNNLLSANKSGSRHQLHPSAREILMKLKQEPADNSDDSSGAKSQQYKPHSCSICYQKFTLASLRNRHVLLTHTKPRNSEERFNDIYDYENDWREAPSPTYDSESNGDSEARKALLIPPKCFGSAGCNHPHIVELNKPAKIGGPRPFAKEETSSSSAAPAPSLNKPAEKEVTSGGSSLAVKKQEAVAVPPAKKEPPPTVAQTAPKRPGASRRSAPPPAKAPPPKEKKATAAPKETPQTKTAGPRGGGAKGRQRQSLPAQKPAAKGSAKKRPGRPGKSKKNSRVEDEEVASPEPKAPEKDNPDRPSSLGSTAGLGSRTRSPSIPPHGKRSASPLSPTAPASPGSSPNPQAQAGGGNPGKKVRLTQLGAAESVREKAQAALRELNLPRKNKETTARWTNHMTFTRSPLAAMSPSAAALSSQVPSDIYDFSDDQQVSSTSQLHQLRNSL